MLLWLWLSCLAERESDREREAEGFKQRIYWGWTRTARAPVCTGPKQEEDGTNMGRNSILGGQLCERERESLRGTRQSDTEADESANCSLSPASCPILKTLLTEVEWLNKERTGCVLVCSEICRKAKSKIRINLCCTLQFKLIVYFVFKTVSKMFVFWFGPKIKTAYTLHASSCVGNLTTNSHSCVSKSYIL